MDTFKRAPKLIKTENVYAFMPTIVSFAYKTLCFYDVHGDFCKFRAPFALLKDTKVPKTIRNPSLTNGGSFDPFYLRCLQTDFNDFT